MADHQQSAQEAPQHHNSPQEAPQETSAPSQDNEPSLPDHGGSDGESFYRDEISEALEAVESGEVSADGEDRETGTALGKPSNGESESHSKEDTAPASAPTDKVKPSALASFHRQQKELFAREQQFKAKEAEYARVMGIIENAKSDRLAALELMGYTDTKSFLESIAEDGGRETPERRQLKELQQWKAKQERERIEQQKQWQEQQQQAVVQSKLDQIKADIQNTLKSDTYKDTVLALNGADEVVLGEMDRMATETGEMPRMEDAIKAVEAKLRERLGEWAANPSVARFFEEKLRQTKSIPNGTPQSKTRARTQTIDSAARVPGTRISTQSSYPDEDSVFAEAMDFLSAQRR